VEDIMNKLVSGICMAALAIAASQAVAQDGA
jgi:hypothetical protein